MSGVLTRRSGEAGRSRKNQSTRSGNTSRSGARRPLRPATADSAAFRWTLIGVGIAFLVVFVIAPMCTVFVSAFSKGLAGYFDALSDPDTRSAIFLTLLTAAISVPLNTVFGVLAAWLVSKYDFPGKSLLVAVIDLPFSVSPVISGLIFVLLFGAQGVFGRWLSAHDIRIIFAVPGIVLATTFVTFPLVAREVLAVMQAQGSDEEEAALTLGANGFQIFYRITLRKISPALIYGVILCNARAMGEFGAVSVVSGHVRGETNTLPLQIEVLYNDYHFSAAFAAASLLACLSIVTLCVKQAVEFAARVRARKREQQKPSLLEYAAVTENRIGSSA
jgi:sulfate transport system permease protein